MKIIHLISYSVILIVLAGCASGSASNSANVATPTLGDPAQAKIAEAAASISHSLVNLAEIQQAVTPPPSTYQPPDPATYGMANLVSIDWAGPIEPLVNQIAEATGYQVRVLGNEPAVPIMVFIFAKNQRIGDILRNAGFQCHDKANIVLYPKSRTIELRYAEV